MAISRRLGLFSGLQACKVAVTFTRFNGEEVDRSRTVFSPVFPSPTPEGAVKYFPPGNSVSLFLVAVTGSINTSFTRSPPRHHDPLQQQPLLEPIWSRLLLQFHRHNRRRRRHHDPPTPCQIVPFRRQNP